MIVYYKLDSLLEERHITKKKLGEETGLSTNIISKISKNEGFKKETIKNKKKTKQKKKKKNRKRKSDKIFTSSNRTT